MDEGLLFVLIVPTFVIILPIVDRYLKMGHKDNRKILNTYQRNLNINRNEL